MCKLYRLLADNMAMEKRKVKHGKEDEDCRDGRCKVRTVFSNRETKIGITEKVASEWNQPWGSLEESSQEERATAQRAYGQGVLHVFEGPQGGHMTEVEWTRRGIGEEVREEEKKKQTEGGVEILGGPGKHWLLLCLWKSHSTKFCAFLRLRGDKMDYVFIYFFI